MLLDKITQNCNTYTLGKIACHVSPVQLTLEVKIAHKSGIACRFDPRASHKTLRLRFCATRRPDRFSKVGPKPPGACGSRLIGTVSSFDQRCELYWTDTRMTLPLSSGHYSGCYKSAPGRTSRRWQPADQKSREICFKQVEGCGRELSSPSWRLECWDWARCRRQSRPAPTKTRRWF